MFKSFKWAALAMVSLGLSPLVRCLLSTSLDALQRISGIGMLALFGVAVETGVIMIEYINQLASRGYTPTEAAIEGAVSGFGPL